MASHLDKAVVSHFERLRMENSFGILRGTRNVVNFNTKAGNPKKPIRYTSIKKAKPKTIIDIGKLLLQRANDAKVNKQSVIAEAALKAATQTAKPAALKQSAALSDSVAADASMQKAPTAPSSSDAESVTPVAAGFVDATSRISDAIKPPVLSSASVKDSNKTTKSVEQGTFPENVDQGTVPEPTATKKIPPEASGSLGLSPPFGTSFEASGGEMAESPQKTAHKNASTFTAPPEAVSDAAPIDVTYSEEVDPVSGFTDIEIASKEPSVGVLSTTGTVTAEIVDSQSVGAVDIPAVPEVFIPEISPAGYSSTKATPTAEDVEIIHALDDATSPPSLSSKDVPSRVEVTQTQMQDVRPLTSETPTDVACYASSSKIISEELAHESAPGAKVSSHAVLELPVTELGVSPVVPYKDTAIQEDVDCAKAVTTNSISVVTPVGRAHRHTTAKIPGGSSSQAEEIVAMTEKVLDFTPEMVFEASVAQSPEPLNGEFAEDGLKTEGEEAVKESSEAQLDPIKRLFLDKIREYSTKSKACSGLVDAGPEYEKAFSEELTKLQRLYGNGDLTAFPEFKFPEPVLDEISSK
ncbi:flocculation protein FLO11 isoform X2 [Colossoma macropomum]|uniref:flocculation protein FLO11 isoform X2 n=1 Tax=Colossoma macropomum TaxID=42526 RepID=UPI001863D739|nr:flocculation protein FLO11 isoform X2 [Colossoma macropomum]XP_036419337.1 flocculation protein FLO11 isoform X2 [Colossoma macropomum]